MNEAWLNLSRRRKMQTLKQIAEDNEVHDKPTERLLDDLDKTEKLVKAGTSDDVKLLQYAIVLELIDREIPFPLQKTSDVFGLMSMTQLTAYADILQQELNSVRSKSNGQGPKLKETLGLIGQHITEGKVYRDKIFQIGRPLLKLSEQTDLENLRGGKYTVQLLSTGGTRFIIRKSPLIREALMEGVYPRYRPVHNAVNEMASACNADSFTVEVLLQSETGFDDTTKPAQVKGQFVDILEYNGEDVRSKTTEERLALLRQAFTETKNLKHADYETLSVAKLFEWLQLNPTNETILLKEAQEVYPDGPTRTWAIIEPSSTLTVIAAGVIEDENKYVLALSTEEEIETKEQSTWITDYNPFTIGDKKYVPFTVAQSLEIYGFGCKLQLEVINLALKEGRLQHTEAIILGEADPEAQITLIEQAVETATSSLYPTPVKGRFLIQQGDNTTLLSIITENKIVQLQTDKDKTETFKIVSNPNLAVVLLSKATSMPNLEDIITESKDGNLVIKTAVDCETIETERFLQINTNSQKLLFEKAEDAYRSV